MNQFFLICVTRVAVTNKWSSHVHLSSVIMPEASRLSFVISRKSFVIGWKKNLIESSEKERAQVAAH